MNRGAAGGPLIAAAATGDALFTVEVAVEGAVPAGFRTVTEFPKAGAVTDVSTTSLAEMEVNSACLNSTDFKCPLVAINQSVSPNDECEIRALGNRGPMRLT